ncbi:chitinase [Allosalinactinospora lopnorensis]|uniref:chitinase n=1 Tax=Allosalinactinospora lopnorensis TaxID=1352348 RepID=UPI000623FD71|nr:chitinase [Allosalinactinospora lopnorensis]
MHAPPRRSTALTLSALTALLGGLLMTAPSAQAQQAEAGQSDVSANSGQWLTGYWHNFDNGSSIVEISEVPSAYNLIAVAFADNHPDLPGGITFNLNSDELNGYTEQEFKDDIAAVQAEGRKVIVSVGGELGHVDVTTPEEAANFADTTHDLMREYGFDGVDIDLEHGVDAQYMADALHDLHGQAAEAPIITMAPQTVDFQTPEQQYYRLAEEISAILTIVNMQYYNSGSMLGCDGGVRTQGTVDFLTAQACIQLEMGLRPDQVGLGLPATPAAAGGGHQPPSNVVQALDCLENGESCGSFAPDEPYGPIGGAMTWSINWDATNGYAFADTVGGRLGTG